MEIEKTKASESLQIPAPNPSGFSCFSPIEIRNLAEFKKSCDVCKLDLKDTKKTLQTCVDHGAPATAWWADPKIIVGGFAVSFGLGAIIASGVLK